MPDRIRIRIDGIISRILKQIDEKGLIFRKGTIMDATLVYLSRTKRRDGRDEAPLSPQDNDVTATKRGKIG